MKNGTGRVLLLALLTACILFGLHFLPDYTVGDTELKRVDLLSDIRQPDSTLAADIPPAPQPKVKPAFKDSCPPGMECIEDYADSTERGMLPFYTALNHRKSLERPVRIAYFGDSFIEGDLFTADLRSQLQQKFGGCGVGFVDMASPIAGFRTSVSLRSNGWIIHSVLDKPACDHKRLGIGQRFFTTGQEAFTEVSGVKGNRLDTFETATLYFASEQPIPLTARINGSEPRMLRASGTGRVEAITLDERMGRVRWTVDSMCGATFFGVAVEGRDGISLDNFSLRGSSGSTLAQVPVSHLQELSKVRAYDLIVLQFGLNVASKDQTNYTAYAKQMGKVISHLKAAFPQAGILIVSVGDREGKLSDGDIHTLPGIKALVRYQQQMAADNGVAFWNLFSAMGGEGSIRRMAEAKPSEAGKDYTHINRRGGKRLAGILFKSLVHGYEQYEKRKAYEKNLE